MRKRSLLSEKPSYNIRKRNAQVTGREKCANNADKIHNKYFIYTIYIQ